MIDERRPIDTPLCYREDKKSREERTRERRGSGGESRELIPGCIEALLSLWFADKLHGLNTARVRPVCGSIKERQRDRGEWNKKKSVYTEFTVLQMEHFGCTGGQPNRE